MYNAAPGPGATPPAPLDSPAFWRAAVDSLPDLVLVVDGEGTLLYINRSPDGSRPEDLLGRRLLDCVPAESRQRLRDALRDVFRGGPAQQHEERIRYAGGRERWYAIHAGPVSLGNEVVATIVVAREVAERSQVAQQTPHSQTIDAVAHLTAGLVHDFNNVLTNVGTAAQVIADDTAAAGGTRDDVDTILAEVKRGAALTRQLLTFLHQLPPVVQEVDLNRVVRDVVAIVRAVVRGPVTIIDTLDPAGVLVRGNRTQLEQVVMNLVLNARDAVGAKGSIALMTTAGPAGARLLVSDSGGGMTDDTRDRIFEPFFTTKARDGGTGLGLSTAHAIVTGLGGTIEVFSAPGVGTTFVVSLPPMDATTG